MTVARYVLKKPDPQIVQQEIERITNLVISKSCPKQIYLIGSAAQGTFDAESDLDFVVVYGSEEEAKHSYSQILNNIGERLFPIDLLSYSAERFSSKKNIGGIPFEAANFGKLLYSKE